LFRRRHPAKKQGERMNRSTYRSISPNQPTCSMKTCKQVAVLAGFLACTMPGEAASTIQFTSTVYSVAENAGTVALSVRRTDDVDTVVQMDYASADGTAIAGTKYVAVAGTLDFGAGETNKAIVVSILNETFVEG